MAVANAMAMVRLREGKIFFEFFDREEEGGQRVESQQEVSWRCRQVAAASATTTRNPSTSSGCTQHALVDLPDTVSSVARLPQK